MGFGFFAKLRCFLRVDHVAFRCIETRLYHEFGQDHLLRETRRCGDSYASLLAKGVDLNDADAIAAAMTETSRITEKITI